jgi:hypothetical protein
MPSWPEFETLIDLTGEAYRARRDALLSTPDLKAKLALQPTDSPWKPRLAAAILQGWLEKKSLYEGVLKELDAIDISWERQKVTGIAGIWERFALRAHREYHSDILPLCWEVVLKHGEDWPDWKVITFLRMMDVVPNERSVEPLIHFIESSPSPKLTDVGRDSLSRQPVLAVQLAVARRLELPIPITPTAATALKQATARAQSLATKPLQ